MSQQTNRTNANLFLSPHTIFSNTAPSLNTTTAGLPTNSAMLNMDDMLVKHRHAEYAEITVLDRTTNKAALQQIQHEIEGQLNRLQNLSNKDFLAEMDVIKHNLNLDDVQMVSLILMTLREVPIRHRNCSCGCYVHIKQKDIHCLFPAKVTNTTSVDTLSLQMECDAIDVYVPSKSSMSPTPPTPQTPDIKMNKHTPFQKLFTFQDIKHSSMDIAALIEAHEYDQIPAAMRSNSQLLEYVDTLSTVSTTEQSDYHAFDGLNQSTAQHVTDTDANNSLWLSAACRMRDVVLFVVPFIDTMVSSFAAYIVFLEVITESYNNDDDTCYICNAIRDIFYGANIHNVLNESTRSEQISFYMILFLRMSTILCWYVLLMHSLVFYVGSCCCCCDVDCESCCIPSDDNTNNDYHLIKHKQHKRKHKQYEPRQSTTALLNSSISIDEHLRSQCRNITSLNLLKFYLRMVMIPNTAAIVVDMLLFDELDSSFLNINGYFSVCLNVAVLFGFYWSLSDWFYFDKEHVLVSWRDVYTVLLIDLLTNWIKYCSEILNFLFFVILCILMVVPLTIFVLLRIVFCPYLFGYNNAGCLICNLFENLIEFMLKTIKQCYV